MTKYTSVIVTGASSGIGSAIARQLCLEGAKVFAIARTLPDLEKVRQALPKENRAFFNPVVCDITQLQEVKRIVKDIFTKNDVDLVINNVGVGYSGEFHQQPDYMIDQIVATNLRGTISVTQSALKYRDKGRHLHIVNTTSLAGKIGFPQLAVYSATKFGIEGFTQALRYEYSSNNIAFSILRPGITDTAFFSKAGMNDYKMEVKKLKSFYSPEKVASIFLSKLNNKSKSIVVGKDKLFIALLPFIPFEMRIRVLNLIDKL